MAEFAYGHRGSGPSRYVRHDVYCSCHFCSNRRAIAPERPKGGSGKRLRETPFLEKKYVDYWDDTYVFEPVLLYSSQLCLNALKSGPSPVNRVGSRVTNGNLSLRGCVQLYGLTGPFPSSFLRLLVVYDRQSNNNFPDWTDVVKSTSVTGTVRSEAMDSFNEDNRQRFKVLVDEQFLTPTLDSSSPAINHSPVDCTGNSAAAKWNFKMSLDLDLPTQYSTTNSGDVTDIVSGAIVMFAVASDSNVAWMFNFSSRIEYVDV